MHEHTRAIFYDLRAIVKHIQQHEAVDNENSYSVIVAKENDSVVN